MLSVSPSLTIESSGASFLFLRWGDQTCSTSHRMKDPIQTLNDYKYCGEYQTRWGDADADSSKQNDHYME